MSVFFPEQTVLHFCSEGQKLIILSNVLLGEMHTLLYLIFLGGDMGTNTPPPGTFGPTLIRGVFIAMWNSDFFAP